MTQRKAVKLGAQKRPSKKYPKILAVPLSAEEIRRRHNITPAEIRRAQRILERVHKQSSNTAK